MFLVQLACDIGPRIWWPSKLGNPELDAAELRDTGAVESETEDAGRR